MKRDGIAMNAAAAREAPSRSRPATLLAGFCTLLVYQLAGDLIAWRLPVPFPGALIGLLLLTLRCVWKKEVPPDIEAASALLLGCLALFYVPAATGLITHLGLLEADWWRIALAIVVSTVAGMTATAFVMRWLNRGDA
ncbi:CidA/LrgA family protein [Caballeronia sp. GAFFF2]|uniref:CidA/LrgA family protein n=1 Tax=Caballeronia sp. GAFFF2 TaxID=2921741 RepID=UPI002028D2BA|nr:CidA/LrgA family protein [Caballeronia sp. GAFFF2]